MILTPFTTDQFVSEGRLVTVLTYPIDKTVSQKDIQETINGIGSNTAKKVIIKAPVYEASFDIFYVSVDQATYIERLVNLQYWVDSVWNVIKDKVVLGIETLGSIGFDFSKALIGIVGLVALVFLIQFLGKVS